MTQNKFSNHKIEFHILQSFPVSCLNRDDVGAPKTAVVGGVQRARVSSQCWKRSVRMEMQNDVLPCGTRSKLLSKLIANACLKLGAEETQAILCGEFFEASFLNKKASKKNKAAEKQEEESATGNQTLMFLSPNEIETISLEFQKNSFNPDLMKSYDWSEIFKKIKKNAGIDGIDLALFGRMMAHDSTMNVEAAASFSHAISTHKLNNEVDFFTALGDVQNNAGAAHMGITEYNSATYYRYISLDLGQLWETLQGNSFEQAVDVFVKALFKAVPSARQNTMSAYSQWDFAKMYIRKGQRLQLSFDSPVASRNSGYLQPSIERLKADLSEKEKRAGSLFEKKIEYTFGEGDSNIDELRQSISEFISKVNNE